MFQLNKIINNTIKKKIYSNYSLIIGLTPSKGARSPKLWNKVYKKNNYNCKMYPADTSQNNLKRLLNYLKADKDFIGGAVTAPYKTKIIKYLDKIDANAKKIGSINIILKKKNKLIGFNTDYYGALSTIKKIGKKKNILILGAGGASKAVVLALTKKFCNSNFYFYNRTASKLNFIKKLLTKKKTNFLKRIEHINLIKDLDLIVNTSSIGFNSWVGDKKSINLKYLSPLTKISSVQYVRNRNSKLFKKKNIDLIKKDRENLKSIFHLHKKINIFDIIYNPKKTILLKYAEIYRNKTYNGLEMNFIQAVKGFMLVNKLNDFNKVKKEMK